MTDTAPPAGGWEPWMDNPLMVDQREGFELFDPPTYHLQVKQPYGGWEPFTTPRQDREEVTRIQAFHLNRNPADQGLRVLTRHVIWTVTEVPGHGEGQTPPEEIIARNDETTQRLLAKDEAVQQPDA